MRLQLQFVSEALASQRIEGTVRLRIWAQALGTDEASTWAATIRIVDADGNERSVLLPMTVGTENERFGTSLAAMVVGPLALTTSETSDGDRIVIELGSTGTAHVVGRDDNQAWAEFSDDLLFSDPNLNLNEEPSRRIGKCIYCGLSDEPLSREHIIPTGLNGEWTLTEASCSLHRDITSRFESDLLRGTFGSARIGLGMRTRRPHDRPSHVQLRVERGGEMRDIPVLAEDYPATIALPVFAPPAHLSGRPYSSGIEIVSARYLQVSGLSSDDLGRKYDCTYIGLRQEYQPAEFARAIAKIGYGFAVLRLGLKRIAECYVLPAVLGNTNDIGRWVGCVSASPANVQPGLHAIRILTEGHELHAVVQLFAELGAPEYQVVIGRIY